LFERARILAEDLQRYVRFDPLTVSSSRMAMGCVKL